mgnify:CR=1 FL=1
MLKRAFFSYVTLIMVSLISVLAEWGPKVLRTLTALQFPSLALRFGRVLARVGLLPSITGGKSGTVSTADSNASVFLIVLLQNSLWQEALFYQV